MRTVCVGQILTTFHVILEPSRIPFGPWSEEVVNIVGLDAENSDHHTNKISFRLPV
jgi:hypothetical protein